MLRPLAMFVFFTVLLTTRADAQVEEPLKLIHEISMPDFHDGDFDHFAKTWGEDLHLLAAEHAQHTT